MSMQMLTILQFAYLLIAYVAVIILLPAAVFYPFFEGKSFGVKGMAYFTIGNFYVINLVFLLELLHIANSFTLIVGTVVPACVAIGFIHWNSWAKSALTFAGEATYGFMLKTMGMRLLLSKLFQSLVATAIDKAKNLLKKILEHPIDTLGTVLVIVFVFWQYGTNTLTNFGYIAADTPVHHYWINAMCKNDLFVAGVYPFGMHCIVYYIHTVFHLEVMTILRLLSLLQVLFLHLGLLIFLRTFCKNAASAYGAVSLFLVADIWNINTNQRLFFSTPQEYGMVFILPAICFLLMFFESRKSETSIKGWKMESTVDLGLFAMGFCLTLAVHFYDTMIAGLFCIAIAIAYIKFIFRKEYFFRILLFGVLSIAVAVLPMATAFVFGTPLEGSLRWGMSIMSEKPISEEMQVSPNQGSVTPQTQVGQSENIGVNETSIQSGNQQMVSVAPAKVGLGTKLKIGIVGKWHKFTNLIRVTNQTMTDAISVALGNFAAGFILLLVIAVFACGVVSVLLGEKQYGSVMVATSVFTMLLICVMMSKMLGIPALMEQSRCSTYLAYAMAMIIGFVMDFLLYAVFSITGAEILQQGLPAIVMVAMLALIFITGNTRPVRDEKALEKNGAIICISNIMRENKPRTFTVLSANDELRMVEHRGYFYEMSELLRLNEGEEMDEYLVIPTPKVYVFIEKIPGEYQAYSEFQGQKVSYESASRQLPKSKGFNLYRGTWRHVAMSRMYYWAKEFQKSYENEVSVYYEDEDFICYEITQNVYRPFDFSFDYGFNKAELVTE